MLSAIGRRTRRHQFRRSLYLDQTHSATALNSDIGVIAVARNLDADLVGNLNDGSAFFSFVYLAVDRHFGHNA